MIIAVDWDGTVVEQKTYDDVTTPFVLKKNAKRGLEYLKEAGHQLLLYSARANRAIREDIELDPLFRAGVRGDYATELSRQLAIARYQEMVTFVEAELSGIFDAIDDGRQGKPDADLFIDDKAVSFGEVGLQWHEIALIWGEAPIEMMMERRA